ncbi:two-component system activity regulator YycH [Staphylococcus aureus]|nr:two-component system activity regulator YycH [Staphylococcus aureus]
MNNKEHIKSVILALLVLMSVVLTYMVWNFLLILQMSTIQIVRRVKRNL